MITAVNGNAVKDSRTLAREISAMAPGSTAKLDILRKGEQKTINVTLATMPSEHQKQANASTGSEDNGSMRGVPHLGLQVAPASEVAGAGAKGVVITGGRSRRPGRRARPAIGRRDPRCRAARASAACPICAARLSDAKSGGKHDVLMRVKSANNTHYVAVPIG